MQFGLSVELQGLEASCHVGFKSCFYRSIPTGNIKEDIKLIYKEDKKTFEPKEYTETHLTQQNFRNIYGSFIPIFDKYS